MASPYLGFSGLAAVKGRPLIDRLMARTWPIPFCGCWAWTGGQSARGYGMAFLPGGKAVSAHRAMMIAHGHDLKPTDVVMHICDMVWCVNPDHLRVATQTENLADMRRKNRDGKGYKIAPEYMAKIREDTETPVWAIAMWFGVSIGTIRNIKTGKTWRPAT